MKQAKEKPAKEWKHFEQEKYVEAASGLAMFNSKLVNTNAPLTWARLDGSAAIDLPYVSVRTLMSRNFAVPLDCANSTRQKAYAQMNSKDGEYDSVPYDELREAKEILEKEVKSAASGNTSFVDRRLRQILLPKADAKGGYVAMTPLPASGLSQVLFSQGGLVRAHNASVKAGLESSMRKIRLASLNYGGSNPQNASSFTRNIQNSILVPAPSTSGDIRRAFAVLYQGISIDFGRDPELSQLLHDYCDFREDSKFDDSNFNALSNSRKRDEEEILLGKVAKAVLKRGVQARQDIEAFVGKIAGAYESIDDVVEDIVENGSISAVSAGLLSALCRSHDWPLELAKFIYARMTAVKGHGEHGRTFNLLVLDSKGERSVLKILEDEIRCSI